MPALMRKEAVELRQHLWGAPTGKPALGTVDADRPVLAGMVDLYDAITQRLT